VIQVLLANPRGFCAGVDRAIDIVERAIELFGAPIYVRHEVVHNRHVVERLRSLGAVFVEELLEVPEGATVIFSAHGVSRAVEEEAHVRRLTVFNATCPLVTKVHMEVQRYAREGLDVILIGHAGHPEVEGTMGRFDTSFGGRMHLVQTVADVAALEVRNPGHLAFVTQTTLSMDDTAEIVATLRQRFPGLATPRHEDICYATQNRQDARARRSRRRARLPDRRSAGPARRVARGQARRRRDRRGLGARGAGAAGPRAARPMGRRDTARGRRPRGAHVLCAAARAAA